MTDYMSSQHQNGGLEATVPDNLKRLVRIIMRSFYKFELYLCMEMLITYPCIKEEDLADILRMELKQVQKNLAKLKTERFINVRELLITTNSGQSNKHNYYSINYKMMVNVIKYKVNKIRAQIEMNEKASTTRANFKCTNCHKTFSDLDTKDIFITLKCNYCNHDIEEDVSCLPSINLLEKFNTQMRLIFDLLSQVENIRLADDVLRPKPVDLSHVLEKINASGSSAGASGGANGNGLANGVDKAGAAAQLNGKSAMIKYDIKWSDHASNLLDQTKISVNFDNASSNGSSGSSVKVKEMPSIILANKTTDETINSQDNYGMQQPQQPKDRDLLLLSNIKKAANDTLINSSNNNLINKNKSKSFNNESTNASQLLTSTSLSSSSLTAPASTTAPKANKPNANTTTKIDIANLESDILHKLLIHEKKPESTSSMQQTTRKRDVVDSHGDAGSVNDLDAAPPPHNKKRKLNNGDTIYNESNNNDDTMMNHNGDTNHKLNSLEPNDEENNEDDNVDDNDEIGADGGGDDGQRFIPKVKVQDRLYRFDKINTKLIKLMNDEERELYISVCRQLYTEMYEI